VITPNTAPQTVALGGTVTFSFTITGAGLSYQWLFNNAVIAGATNPTYTIAAVTAANAGNYSVRVTNAGGSVTSNQVSLTVSPAVTGIAFLNNLSVRARAGSGSETLIVGVTVGGGTASTPKSALIRGVGPTLASFGVTGFLADPVLSVLSGTTTIATNDDWNNDATIASTSAALGAFPLLASSRDAALVGSGFGNGSYTVQVTGKGGTTGNALVELYDTAAPASITATTTRFTNVSARTFGGVGAETLIVGFNVAGTASRRVVIRAVGPGLAAFGVTGVMPDPKLELYSGQTKLDENDNWNASSLAAQQSVGAFALTAGSRDAVLIATLNPGAYTVQVTGGTTGVVLVEAYEAP
jgi:PKD repeat protein